MKKLLSLLILLVSINTLAQTRYTSRKGSFSEKKDTVEKEYIFNDELWEETNKTIIKKNGNPHVITYTNKLSYPFFFVRKKLKEYHTYELQNMEVQKTDEKTERTLHLAWELLIFMILFGITHVGLLIENKKVFHDFSLFSRAAIIITSLILGIIFHLSILWFIFFCSIGMLISLFILNAIIEESDENYLWFFNIATCVHILLAVIIMVTPYRYAFIVFLVNPMISLYHYGKEPLIKILKKIKERFSKKEPPKFELVPLGNIIDHD